MNIKPPIAAKFAVVIDPGSLFERVDSWHMSMLTAQSEARDLREDFENVDVMRVVPATINEPARLTTEF